MDNLKAFLISFFIGFAYVFLKGFELYSFVFLLISALLYYSFESIYFFLLFPLFFFSSIFSINEASKIIAITAPAYFAFYKQKESKHKKILLRKFVHILLSLILIFLFLISKSSSLIFTLFLFESGFFLFNLQKTKIYSVNFLKIDENEFNENAFKAFWLTLAFLFLFSFFEEKIVLVSSLVLCISDSVAAFGKFGKTKIHKNKTLLGSLLFFISSFLIASFFVKIYVAILYSIFVTMVEAFSPIEDNFPIALSSSLILKFFGI